MRNISKVLFVFMITGLLFNWPVSSYADWNGHDGHDGHSNSASGHSNSGHSHDNGGNSHRNGGGYNHGYIGVNFSVWPDTYDYNTLYYPPEDGVIVSSPVYQPVLINGVTYYFYNGTYYVYNGYSYQPVAPPVNVVQQPVTVQEPAVEITQVADTSATPGIGESDSFTINIPNSKGSYTAVTLKKSGNGFTGPQGEFYPEFPKVSQLEVIYGK